LKTALGVAFDDPMRAIERLAPLASSGHVRCARSNSPAFAYLRRLLVERSGWREQHVPA